MNKSAPYGTWPSPLSAELVAAGAEGLADPIAGESALYWVERRPDEGGRSVIVRLPGAGAAVDVIAPPWSARTRVHEYGGLSYAVGGSRVYFVNDEDQRLYEVDGPGAVPRPLTDEPGTKRGVRFAAPTVSPDGEHLYAVRERHLVAGDPAQVVNDIVVLDTGVGRPAPAGGGGPAPAGGGGPAPAGGGGPAPAGGGGPARHEPAVVAAGHDFYSGPVVSPDGRHLAFCAWDHPRMPWDGTTLFEAELDEDGRARAVRRLAGGDAESITQPRYGPDGRLYFISDRTGWWNLYRGDRGDEADGDDRGDRGDRGGRDFGQAVVEMAAEFAYPDWIFGWRDYDILSDGSVVASWASGGFDHLGVLLPDATRGTYELVEIETGFVAVDYVAIRRPAAGSETALLVGSRATSPPEIAELSLGNGETGGGPTLRTIRKPRQTMLDPEDISIARAVELAVDGGTVHGLYFPPTNHAFAAPAGELPPLIVLSHGGPTGAISPRFSAETQFFTTRGFAVVAVNYRGSAGYGRAYRRFLYGKWGISDVADCIALAEHLARGQLADPERLVIRGGSAGGYCVLRALTTSKVFAAGLSHYGIGDLCAFAPETHKFESRYCDALIGPWPEAEDEYRARSPVFNLAGMTTPTVLFQGLEDKVVPPDQAELMANALRENGVSFCHMTFEGEGHGFRKASTISAVLDTELGFLGAVLKLAGAEQVSGPPIENLSPPG